MSDKEYGRAVNLASDINRIDEMKADLAAMREFAQFMFKDFPDSQPDECEMQDKAVELGLLQGVEVAEPCCDGCNCDDFPMTCYRRTSRLTGKGEG